MSNEPILKKEIWTETDFEEMSWHDNKIHAIAFDGDNNRMLLDIDYICKWVKKQKFFLFWVAPSTLVFRNVYDVNISSNTTNLVISEISRYDPQKPCNSDYIEEQIEYEWCIETTAGEITFKSVGYKQFVRNKPILIKRQELNPTERGGFSFATGR